MNKYCKNHKDEDYCKCVRFDASKGFCTIVCKGEYKKYQNPDLDKIRAKLRRPVLDDGETVSVIIPYGKYDLQYLDQTVKSVKDNATGKIEIITEFDKFDQGHRFLTNKAAKVANGKYLLRLDAHCAMSEGWDSRMKISCGETDLVTPVLDGLRPGVWLGKNKDMGVVVLSKRMRNQYVVSGEAIEDRYLEEDTMSIIGCCWMVQKDYYWQLDGCDEQFGKWGVFGPEWALKVWLTGGRCLIRTDTVCCHLFRKRTPFAVDVQKMDKVFIWLCSHWTTGQGKNQSRPMSWLLNKFAHYLDWSNVKSSSSLKALHSA